MASSQAVITDEQHPQDQLAPNQLNRIAAQRHLYSTAKWVQGWQIVLATVFPVLWSLLIFWFPHLNKAYGAFWTVLIGLADVVLLAGWQSQLREKAAKIQELFD